MKNVLRIFTVCLLSLFISVSIAPAEEKEKKAVNLDEIVVTATRTEKALADAPGDASVITKKDIEKRNIQSVDQALNTLPGVSVIHRSVTDFSPSINLRGIPYGKGRTLVIMDGISVTDTMQGALWGITGLSPGDVERIEIVQGPFSSLYGGNAMGGVVNIITKMPTKMEITLKGGYGTSWESGKANDDLKKFYVSYGDKFKDKLSVFLSYGKKATNGFPIDYNVQSSKPPAGISGWSSTTDASGNTRYLIGDKGVTSYWDDNLTLKTGLDISSTSKIYLSYYKTRFNQHMDPPNTYLKDAAGKSVWSYGTVKNSSFLAYNDSHREQNLYHLGYETELYNFKTKFSFGLADTTFKNVGVPAGGLNSDHPELNHYDADLQIAAPIFMRQLFTFGGSLRHNWGSFKEYNGANVLAHHDQGKDMTFGLFLQDEILITNNISAYLGFRQDWWKAYDGQAYQLGIAGSPVTYNSTEASASSPKLSFVYKPVENTALRASAGTAFRSPVILETYLRFTNPSGITYAGNPNLKPETAKLWDIGVEQGLWKGAKVKATYFENYMNDFIQQTMTTPTLYEYQNVAKAESKGIELGAEQQINKWLRLFANYTYTDAKVKENPANPKTVGKRLTMIPENMFNIGADLTYGLFTFNIVGRYQSKIYRNDDNSDRVDNVYLSYDPYFTADAKISYNIKKFAILSFSVDNIFDADYFYSSKAPRRSCFLELTLKF